MIDLSRESLLTLSQAGKRLPAIDGRPVDARAIWRWALHGCRGVALDHVRLGGRVLTSVEALTRFGNALAEKAKAELGVTTPHVMPGLPRSPTQRERDIGRAERELEQAGV